MKHTIFTSLSCDKLIMLLQTHTAASRRETESHVWKNSKHPKQEWACLVGTWKDKRFQGRLYRRYKEQTSGGIALPVVSLQAEPAGNISQLQLKTRVSNSFFLLILAFIAVTALQIAQIISALPKVTVVSIVVLIGWLLMCGMMFVFFYNQYQHECQAVELTLKTMTKAFDS